MQNDQKPTPRFSTFLMGEEKDDRVKTGPRASTFSMGLKNWKNTKNEPRASNRFLLFPISVDQCGQ